MIDVILYIGALVFLIWAMYNLGIDVGRLMYQYRKKGWSQLALGFASILIAIVILSIALFATIVTHAMVVYG